MKTIEVTPKEVETVRKMLLNNDLLALEYKIIKEKNKVYLPLKNDSPKLKGYKIVDKKLTKSQKFQKLTDILKNKISKEELELLPKSIDTIGDIAIIEVPEGLNKKEKLIAQHLLKTHKGLKTIAKKAGHYSGLYRTRKLKILAGENKKETIHKENDVIIKLNVETCYFSPRSSTERKRISQLIKPGEDVLVMFSGVAPFPLVFAKHTQARGIYGVELNPEAHKYALENVAKNKFHNVHLLQGDVKKILPNFYEYLIGLKSSIDLFELNQRLKLKPQIMELHLFEKDLFERLPKLEKTIKNLQKKGIKVILHMPFKFEGEHIGLDHKHDKQSLYVLGRLGKLCKKYKIKAIVHPSSEKGCNRKQVIENLKKLEEYFEYFYFENVTQGIFCKTKDIYSIAKKVGIKNICIDTAHLYIVYKNNNKIIRHIKKMQKHFNTYFHLNDYDGKTHSAEIGTGFIKFEKILPYVNFGVTEVISKNEKHPLEMLNSYKKIKKKTKKFDRILMPLPKSANQFLDIALSVAKKGATIHYYDFLHEKEMPQEAIKKIKKHQKRFKIKYWGKCGQYAPNKSRVCVDFKI